MAKMKYRDKNGNLVPFHVTVVAKNEKVVNITTGDGVIDDKQSSYLTGTADKTASQILEYINSGYKVIAKYNGYDFNYMRAVGSSEVRFTYTITDSNKTEHWIISVKDDGSAIVLRQEIWYKQLPEPRMKMLVVGDSLFDITRSGGHVRSLFNSLGLGEIKHCAISGATLADKCTDITNIPQQLSNFKSANPDYYPDVILADGGANDYLKSSTYLADLGTIPTRPVITENDLSSLSNRRDTVMGGMEYLFVQMCKHYPNAQRFFLIPHRILMNKKGYLPLGINAETGSGTYKACDASGTRIYTFDDYYNAMVQCCKVYGVKVIDCYNESALNTINPTLTTNPELYLANTSGEYDGLHPTALGYEIGYKPLIKQALGLGTNK